MKRFAVLIAVLVLAGLLPLLMPTDFFRHLLVMSVIFAMLALGYNAQFGYAGLFNMGHAAFFGIGAYASAIMATRFGWPFVAGLSLGATVSGLVAAALGSLTLRTRGPHFAMMTLGLGQVLYLIFANAVELTRGPLGISGIPAPEIEFFGYAVRFDNELSFYYVALLSLVIAYLIFDAILNSRLGSAWRCVRDNEDLAAALGVNPSWAKMSAFIFGSILAAVAGSLYAHYIRLVTPELLSVQYLVMVLIMVVVGGRGTFFGPVLGAVLFTMIPEGLRFTESMRMAIFGLLLLIFVLFLPEGIGSYLSRTGAQITRKWRRSGAYENTR
jgi:branched-chain amino acid transport system permease protein